MNVVFECLPCVSLQHKKEQLYPVLPVYVAVVFIWVRLQQIQEQCYLSYQWMWRLSVYLCKHTAQKRAALSSPASVCGCCVYLGKATRAMLPVLPMNMVFECLPGVSLQHKKEQLCPVLPVYVGVVLVIWVRLHQPQSCQCMWVLFWLSG